MPTANVLRVRRILPAALLVCFLTVPVSADEPSGAQIYQKLCVSCHGPDGEGTADNYPNALVGDRSVNELTRYITKSMPEGEPEKCVGEDARNGRIYLPQDDMRRFGVTEEQLIRGVHTPAFAALMQFEHDRAREFYRQAEKLLPPEDRQTMLAAEMMAQVYSEILEKIRKRDFQVFGPRIGLGKLRKITILSAYTARGFLGAV